ncbi:LysR substrate-binding domain-containing protein [Consotaella aegiceratis]|uniref:LysR substrate-binding domain-containing protein n=1 Tax=Consotaella aegiceratis TaxID=3097961 RepID=UPI002F4279E6
MDWLNRVHLNALRAADAAGRCGSLKAAALEMGVTPGAISQHILKLEAQLGHKLFERTSRGLAPTAFGTLVLPQLAAGFAQLERALVSAQNHAASTLTLSVAPVFAAKWLVPRLGRFSRLHPEIRVRLEATIGLVNPDASDIDLAVRVGDGNYPGVDKQLLLAQEVFPVCSPELAARLRQPRDILAVPILRDSNSVLRWSLWLDRFGIDERELGDGYTFTDAALCLDAAIGGQGVMLAWQFLAHDALAEGRLVAPFPERATTGLGYWLITSAARRSSPQILAFVDWIKTEVTAADCL